LNYLKIPKNFFRSPRFANISKPQGWKIGENPEKFFLVHDLFYLVFPGKFQEAATP
jgi:hypothetical protein